MKRSRQDTLSSFFSSEQHFTGKNEKISNSCSRFVKCPLCERSLPLHKIESHASECNSVPVHDESLLKPSKHQILGSTEDSISPESDRKTSNFYDHLKNSSSSIREFIPGLYIHENFITEEEEKEIIGYLDGPNDIPWKEAKFNGKFFGKRWGVHCSLRDRKVYDEENPIPLCVKQVIDRLRGLRDMKGCVPNEANAIDYRRRNGDYLKSHVDDRQLSKEPIANLSLAGDCIMTFRLEKEKLTGILPETVKVTLRRRTLQVLTQKARYDYSHGIENDDLLNDRRISITMRESPLTPKCVTKKL